MCSNSRCEVKLLLGKLVTGEVAVGEVVTEEIVLRKLRWGNDLTPQLHCRYRLNIKLISRLTKDRLRA